MVSFVAVIYIVKKKSVDSLICAGIGAAVNLILNFILIKTMSAMGAAIATMLSYIAVFFVTTYLSRELVRYRVKIHFLAINFGLVLLQSILTVLEVKYYIVFSVIITLIVAVINFKSVYGTVRDLLSRRGRNAVKADEDENKTEAIENE